MTSHVWSSWSLWSFAGGGQDSRDRHCRDAQCGKAETQYRTHQHDRGTEETVKGVKIRKCNGCGATL